MYIVWCTQRMSWATIRTQGSHSEGCGSSNSFKRLNVCVPSGSRCVLHVAPAAAREIADVWCVFGLSNTGVWNWYELPCKRRQPLPAFLAMFARPLGRPNGGFRTVSGWPSPPVYSAIVV